MINLVLIATIKVAGSFGTPSILVVCPNGQATAGSCLTPTPGPLSVLGVAAAWGASRKLRKRIRKLENESHY